MKEYKILNRVLGNIEGQVLLALILFIAAFMFFYGLSYPSVRMWDKSRLAVNTLDCASKYIALWIGLFRYQH